MKKVRLTVHGRVQGVGFRYMTKMVADRLKVNGLVKNLADGGVYIEAVGTAEAIAEFIKLVEASPTPSGRVTQLDVVEDDTLPDYFKFKVTG